MTINYWNLNDGEVERARAVVVEWGSQENEEAIDALITAWTRLTTTETTDRASGRAEQLERDLEAANTSLAEWRQRYRDDIVKIAKERDAALNQIVVLERENAAVKRELEAVNAELASCSTTDEEQEGPTRAERQLTAKMRVLIDEHLGKRTPGRIREIAEGNFPEDRTPEQEQESRRGRRSRRGGGRHARRNRDYTNPTFG